MAEEWSTFYNTWYITVLIDINVQCCLLMNKMRVLTIFCPYSSVSL